jgi:O-antigen/teichoic acid export membrane protein
VVFSQVLLGVGGVIVARALGPEGRGVVVGIGAWMAFFPLLWLLGMNAALGVRVAEAPRDVGIATGTALTYAFVVGIPVAVGAAVLAPRLVAGLGSAAGDTARWAIPITVMVSMLNEMLLAIALASGRFFAFNAARVVLPLVPLCTVIVLASTGHLTPSLVIAANVAGSAVCLILLSSSTQWRGITFNRLAFAADARFGLKTSLSGWAGMANDRLDFLLMSSFVSATQLGYYGVANNAMLLVTTVPFSAATLLTPRVARLFGQNSTDRHEIVQRQAALVWATARRYLLVALLGGVLLGISAPFAVPAVFGHPFRGAVILIWILIPGYIARVATVIIVSGASGMRLPHVGNAAELSAVFVTVALLALLLPSMAATGAAIASTSAYCVSALVAFVRLRRSESAAFKRRDPRFGLSDTTSRA